MSELYVHNLGFVENKSLRYNLIECFYPLDEFTTSMRSSTSKSRDEVERFRQEFRAVLFSSELSSIYSEICLSINFIEREASQNSSVRRNDLIYTFLNLIESSSLLLTWNILSTDVDEKTCIDHISHGIAMLLANKLKVSYFSISYMTTFLDAYLTDSNKFCELNPNSYGYVANLHKYVAGSTDIVSYIGTHSFMLSDSKNTIIALSSIDDDISKSHHYNNKYDPGKSWKTKSLNLYNVFVGIRKLAYFYVNNLGIIQRYMWHDIHEKDAKTSGMLRFKDYHDTLIDEFCKKYPIESKQADSKQTDSK